MQMGISINLLVLNVSFGRERSHQLKSALRRPGNSAKFKPKMCKARFTCQASQSRLHTFRNSSSEERLNLPQLHIID